MGYLSWGWLLLARAVIQVPPNALEAFPTHPGFYKHKFASACSVPWEENSSLGLSPTGEGDNIPQNLRNRDCRLSVPFLRMVSMEMPGLILEEYTKIAHSSLIQPLKRSHLLSLRTGMGVACSPIQSVLAWELFNQARSPRRGGSFRDLAEPLSLAGAWRSIFSAPCTGFREARVTLSQPLSPCDLQVLGVPQLRC